MHRVGDSIDAADFISVVSRDRHLLDPVPALEELEDDLCVEVPVVGHPLQRDVP